MAHEREVEVIQARRLNKARMAEDAADFEEACVDAGQGYWTTLTPLSFFLFIFLVLSTGLLSHSARH